MPFRTVQNATKTPHIWGSRVNLQARNEQGGGGFKTNSEMGNDQGGGFKTNFEARNYQGGGLYSNYFPENYQLVKPVGYAGRVTKIW